MQALETGIIMNTHTDYSINGQKLPPNWIQRVLVIWTGQTFSVLSTFAASFAAMWYITETEASALYLALAGVASLLPVGILSPFGGIAADRFSRKKVMLISDASVGFVSALLAVLVIMGNVSTPLILILLALRSSAQAFHAPALMAMAPQLVPERHLVRINTFDQMLSSGSGIIGPVLGIFLYTTIGFEAVLFLDTACAAIACTCLLIAKIPKHHISVTSSPGVIKEVTAGVAYIKADKGLVGLMILIMLAMVIFTPLATLYPLMTYEWFSGTGYQASLVEAVAGMGMLVGSIILLVWGGGKRLVPIILISGFAMGIGAILCGLLQQHQFIFFVILAGFISMAIGMFNGPILPIIQKRIDEDKTGRVMGLFLTGSTLATPLGLCAAGIGAEYLGLTTWFLICGIILCLVQIIASTRPSVINL